jgi:hypothetical protein
VRIVGGNRGSRTAYISLLIALVVALMALGYWRVWRSDQPSPPPQRALADIELTWKCPAGHRFTANGQIGPRTCEVCQKPADIVARYTCGKHEPVEIFVRVEPDWSPGNPNLTLRLGDGPPMPSGVGLKCPKCGLRLRAANPDPLAGVRGRK